MSDIHAIDIKEDYEQGTRICKLPSMSVYTFDWKWNTWHGFWRNIKQWFSNRKAAKQRAKLGYCYGDIWDCGNNICQRMAHMLTAYRNKCCSWPDRDFPTFKEWIAYIDEIIDLLEFAESDPDELNEYTEAFSNALHSTPADKEDKAYEELRQKYYNECRSIYDRQTAARQKALTMFAKYADNIWW